MAEIIADVRTRTERPLLAKLAPNDPDIGATARVAAEAGVDGITAVNTLPGILLDPVTGRPGLGAGPGGVSGPALFPIGVEAVRRVRAAVDVPVIGAGGILRADHALSYMRAGADLVQVGTGSFADPRCAERVALGIAGAAAPDPSAPPSAP